MDTKIFDCVKLFEVEEDQPAAGGEAPNHGIGSDLTRGSSLQASYGLQ